MWPVLSVPLFNQSIKLSSHLVDLVLELLRREPDQSAISPHKLLYLSVREFRADMLSIKAGGQGS